MTPTATESQLLERLKEILSKSVIFECVACGTAQQKSEMGHVGIYRPRDSEISKIVSKAGVYVICRTCEELPEKSLDERILKTLSKNGYLG